MNLSVKPSSVLLIGHQHLGLHIHVLYVHVHTNVKIPHAETNYHGVFSEAQFCILLNPYACGHACYVLTDCTFPQ
jgi:hypothetical protein